MIAYIPNINQWQGLGFELHAMVPYNIYIIYISANGVKAGVLQMIFMISQYWIPHDPLKSFQVSKKLFS